MKYVYEFIGTFFLVLTIGMVVINPGAAAPLAPLAIGSVLAVMIYAGGHVSGGHYNPAVSLAAFFRGILSLQDLGLYWVSQLIGGAAAAYLALYLHGNPTVVAMELSPFKALVAEFLFTFALCYVVLNTATAKETQGNSFYGFAIGFTVLAGAYAVGTLSSGAFNPAVALGLSIMKKTLWSHLWIFIVASVLGSAAAAWIFKAAHCCDSTHQQD